MKNSFLLFMFGSWKIIENEENTFNHIKELFQTITNEDEITFITGENVLIANIKKEILRERVQNAHRSFQKKRWNFLAPNKAYVPEYSIRYLEKLMKNYNFRNYK